MNTPFNPYNLTDMKTQNLKRFLLITFAFLMLSALYAHPQQINKIINKFENYIEPRLNGRVLDISFVMQGDVTGKGQKDYIIDYCIVCKDYDTEEDNYRVKPEDICDESGLAIFALRNGSYQLIADVGKKSLMRDEEAIMFLQDIQPEYIYCETFTYRESDPPTIPNLKKAAFLRYKDDVLERIENPEEELAPKHNPDWRGTYSYSEEDLIWFTLEIKESGVCTIEGIGRQTFHLISCITKEEEGRLKIYYDKTLEGAFPIMEYWNKEKPILELFYVGDVLHSHKPQGDTTGIGPSLLYEKETDN